MSKSEFDEHLAKLRAKLAEQGRAVLVTIETAVDGAFERNPDKARLTIERDQQIDRMDVEIEREAVKLLTDALKQGVPATASDVRAVLTIVKINNELERIADSAVNIAEKTPSFMSLGAKLPPRFHMMANSVIGIMQTTNTAFAKDDLLAAELVLASDDATEHFKAALLRETLEQLVRNEHTLDHAKALQTVAANLGSMADHCTNIAEQVIYIVTGKVVRHEGDRWSKPEDVA